MENTYKIFEMIEKMSKDMPTVYDCEGCKYNTGLIKDKHCNGCRVPNGSSWMYRQRPINYEEVPITFATQAGENKNV